MSHASSPTSTKVTTATAPYRQENATTIATGAAVATGFSSSTNSPSTNGPSTNSPSTNSPSTNAPIGLTGAAVTTGKSSVAAFAALVGAAAYFL